jgi:hypothetical protein
VLEYSIPRGGDLITAEQMALNEQADKLYEQYGKTLEREHWGEYVAIFPDGRTVWARAPTTFWLRPSTPLVEGASFSRLVRRLSASGSARVSSAPASPRPQ